MQFTTKIPEPDVYVCPVCGGTLVILDLSIAHRSILYHHAMHELDRCLAEDYHEVVKSDLDE